MRPPAPAVWAGWTRVRTLRAAGTKKEENNYE